MTQPRDDDRIAHIVEAAEQAIAFTHGRTRADLDDDRMLQLALTKLVEVVGEAAKVAGLRRSRARGCATTRCVRCARRWVRGC
jgi:uncharacterized protein with HEPN domain